MPPPSAPTCGCSAAISITRAIASNGPTAGANNAAARWPIPLRGANQLLNASAALAALESVRELLPVPQQAVRMGLLQASLPGRFQILPGQPAVILDVAHNPHAAAVLAQNLDNMGFHPYTHAVFGMLNDKDLAGVVAKLGSRVDHWYCAGLPGRAAPAAKTWRGRSARPCRPRQRR